MRRLVALLLVAFSLSCGSLIRVAGFGDSLTAGEDWMDLLPPDYKPLNFGVPGEKSWEGVPRLLAELPTLNADVVTIFWGTNDVTRGSWSLANTLDPLTTAVDAVLAAGMQAVLVVPPPVFGDFGAPAAVINDRLAELEDALVELGASRGVPVAHVNEAFWLHPSIPDDFQDLYLDFVHPNWDGRAIEVYVIQLAIEVALFP